VSAPNRRARRPASTLIGLILVYAGTAALAIWQASTHPSPTIFTDEIEMTQLARSIPGTQRSAGCPTAISHHSLHTSARPSG